MINKPGRPKIDIAHRTITRLETENAALRAENDKLRSDNDRLSGQDTNDYIAISNERDALRAENDKLSAALKLANRKLQMASMGIPVAWTDRLIKQEDGEL